MNCKVLPLLLLASSIGIASLAQTKETAPKDKKVYEEKKIIEEKKIVDGKKETITIRKKGDGTEKMTIIVDGDQITLNGKNLKDMQDADIEILRKHGNGPETPMAWNRRIPMEGFRINADNLSRTTNKAFLGVVTEKSDKGAKVTNVEKGSAAEKAGLKNGDVITKIGETGIGNSDDLYKTIGKFKPEDKITIHYQRDGKDATASAILGKNQVVEERVFNFNGDDFNFEAPRMNGMNFNFNRKPRLGLQIQDQEDSKGVKVLDVDEESPASKAGLKEGDLITEIDGKAITSVEDLKNKTKDMKEGDSFKISYSRDGKTMSTDLKFPKKLKTVDL